MPEGVQHVDGFIRYPNQEDPIVEVRTVRWVEGERELVMEWREEGEEWELRLVSWDQVVYCGFMHSPGYRPVSTEMTKWVSPSGDRWLLLGAFNGVDGEVEWAIHLERPAGVAGVRG